MSEPVGNSPRSPGGLPNIPSNSHSDREVKASVEVEPKEPVQKIVEGKVTTRKTPWFKRFAKSMVADDAQSIGDWIMVDVLIPSIKNMIRDAVVGGVDRGLYGSSRARSRGVMGQDRPSLRTRYDKMSEGEPRKMMSREDRARHDFDSVVLDTRNEAVEVVEALIELVSRYGSASVRDMYDLLGVTGGPQDLKWGWMDLREADVRQVRGGFLLDLPQPQPLR